VLFLFAGGSTILSHRDARGYSITDDGPNHAAEDRTLLCGRAVMRRSVQPRQRLLGARPSRSSEIRRVQGSLIQVSNKPPLASLLSLDPVASVICCMLAHSVTLRRNAGQWTEFEEGRGKSALSSDRRAVVSKG
jgi:hypothetical protein